MTRYMLLTKYDNDLGVGPMSEWDPDDITAHPEYLRKPNQQLIANAELVDGQALRAGRRHAPGAHRRDVSEATDRLVRLTY